MANPGIGSKFVSVNLNKSYGQPSRSSTNAGASRVRSGSHVGGGGNMVVLPRRSSVMGAQKSVPKLSVPPPLNLPSLRKEHERFDSSLSGSGSAGAGNSGAGSRPTSSGMGWTKPAPSSLQEKDGGDVRHFSGISGAGGQKIDGGVSTSYSADVGTRGTSVYMPPSARPGTVGPALAASARVSPPVEKTMVLRGEDFPSLQATLPVSSGPNQKQKQKASEEASSEQLDGTPSRSLLHMRPQMQQASSVTVGSGSGENGALSHGSSGSSLVGQSRKQDDYFPGPLPVVRLNHTSDWADDERDTALSLQDRDRNHGFSRIRNRELDSPRGSVLAHTSVHDMRGLHDDESGKFSSREVVKEDPYSRDVRTPSREGRDGSSWRASPHTKTGFGARETRADISGAVARPFSLNRETNKGSKYGQLPFGGDARHGFGSAASGTQGFRHGGRDLSYGQGDRQGGNHISGRGAEQNMRDQYGGHLSKRHGGDVFQSSITQKSSFSWGSKGIPVNDPIFNFGREKRPFSNGGKPYLDDPFLKDFSSDSGADGKDPFSGGLVGVFKRKKDVLKHADFHDPIRESFEAELERVQKMQEQERQRVMEEQTRALELARKEEEERERLAREEEDRRRRIEEEAREAAWREEQERLEAMRRAEEQKIAREEEKRMVLLEEERRKEAARQKLLELEARMARRRSESTKDEKFPSAVGEERKLAVIKEKEVHKVADLGDWEDGERMVERITSYSSSDSSSLNRSFEMGSRPHSYRDGNSAFLDRGRHANPWRRDVFENGNGSTFLLQDQENGYRSLRRDAFGAGRAFPRKEFYGGHGVMPANTSSKGGIPEAHAVDDFPHLRGPSWNTGGDGDHYGRNSEVDPEFHDNLADKFDDMGWGEGHSHGSLHASYPERLYKNSEGDGFSSFARSRHSMRQPRVLPPPSVASMHRNTFRAETNYLDSSGFIDSDTRYHQVPRKSEPTMQAYNRGYQEKCEHPGILDAQRENAIPQEQKVETTTTPRCDSQSSLSVSSPPNSPTHLSHYDLYDSGDSPVFPTAVKDEDIHLSDDENVVSTTEDGNVNMMTASGSVSPVEDEDWAVEENGTLQEQEEYDEEEDGYNEEDEVHERGDENTDLHQDFEDLLLEEKDAPGKTSQVVLGFDDGVEVDFERSSRNGEKVFETKQVSVGISEEPGSLDGLVGNMESHQLGNNSPKFSMEGSSMIQGTENELQDLVLKPLNVSCSTTASSGYLFDSVETSSSSIPPVKLPDTSSVDMALPPPLVQPIVSTVSAVPNQAEVPVKLQFGLFSGPSLIPSPVPAIQIGSIQMPLHVHSQVGPPLTQIHPTQPPFFQFGQLGYVSPISQGMLPLAPQSMSFVHPNVPGHNSLNQNRGDPLHNQVGHDPSTQNNLVKGEVSSVPVDSKPGVPKLLDPSLGNTCNVALSSQQGSDNEVLMSQSHAERSCLGENKFRSESVSLDEDQEHNDISIKKSYKPVANNRESQRRLQAEPTSSQYNSKAPGPISGSRGKRFIYTVRESGSKSYAPVSDAPQTDQSGFLRKGRRNTRRTEYRVRQNADKRHTEGLVSSNYSEQDEKLSLNGRVSGISARNGGKKDAILNKPLTPSFDISRSGEVGSGRYRSSGEDVDAPLQSGVVRVFKQPGIEAPSDEDDFIEVRSKRQMLNDRREQKEKEIKAKARVIKAPRKPLVSQNIVVTVNSNKIDAPLKGEGSKRIHCESVVTDARGLMNAVVSAGFTTTVGSQSLPPIGTPTTLNTDVQADIRSHTNSLQAGIIPVVSSGGTSIGPGLSFESKNVVLDNVPTSLGSWSNAHINQQVMALTQTQLDEAMKPTQFDAHVASISNHTGLTQDKSFSSSSSPLNSLLAGEKIQFGAVTSPTILPPSSHAVLNGIGAPGSCRPNDPMDHNFSASQSSCSLFFEKEKHPDQSYTHLEDPEAEAEAAASAVAVAAISSDEIVGNGLGASSSVSVSETKSFGCADIEGLTTRGVAGEHQLTNQSRGDESLTVALPADLSVETPSLSLWPPLPSPQNSASQMLPHFPGAPPSHFPCYEMNPMLGPPIFAFGPHDESSGSHSQSQKSSTLGSGSLGAWQQCHSGVDSFYGPPAGFTGPFISPPGGIPGVQGPPHMVVYNHFAPVGQFGQVGLSFMGTTYIPSGKQPDWKHNPTSSAMGIGEGETNTVNGASVQRNPPSMPAPIQHLAPGSPLLPMASPLAMFDMSPFQSSSDVPVQTRWSPIPASSLHSVPLSMPLQQQAEGVRSSHFSHGLSVDQPFGSRFHEPCSSAPPDSNTKFSVATDASAVQFPDELGLVDSSSSSTAQVSTRSLTSYNSTSGNSKAQAIVRKSSSRGIVASAGESGSNISTSSSSQSMNSAFKTQSSQQYLDPTVCMDDRGVSQKVVSGSEWSHRRMGFQGRNQSSGTDKTFASSKMKQIYVAKPATSGTKTAI